MKAKGNRLQQFGAQSLPDYFNIEETSENFEDVLNRGDSGVSHGKPIFYASRSESRYVAIAFETIV